MFTSHCFIKSYQLETMTVHSTSVEVEHAHDVQMFEGPLQVCFLNYSRRHARFFDILI